MKVSVLQHVPFEGLGSIEEWLLERDAKIHTTRFFEDAQLPNIEEIDFVIAMGGPMSVNDEAQLPWLIEEKAFISDAIKRGSPVIGICLGSQLIASALGARIYANPQKEIGWFSIEAVETPPTAFQFPSSAHVFHWHGETFDLPSGAIRLAKSAACANQAFQIGKNVIGLQFHLETTKQSAELILEHCGDELVDAPYIQSEQSIRNEPSSSFSAINQLMADVLSYVTHSR